MKVSKTEIDGLLIIEPEIYKDERGFFLESYQIKRYNDHGITDHFIQDNFSFSTKNILRGLHYQINFPQSQLVSVVRGSVFDVVVDLRNGSNTFGKWFGIELNELNRKQLYMPPGFAHGFCVLSDFADFHYKVTRNYDKDDEGGLNWNDSEIGIKWPLKNPTINQRDNSYPFLKDIKPNFLPQ
jgi:dTDP-4-dehydrorhamnose 3,5-epimerase